MAARNTMQVRVPKDEFNNAKSWAIKEIGMPLKNSDVFKFLYHNTLMGDVKKIHPTIFGKQNKKGSWLDVGYFVVVIAFFAICLLVGTVILNNINNGIQSSPNMGTEGQALSQKITTKFIGTYNAMFLILVIGLMLVSLALAAMVKVHPIFIPIFFIALIFLVWVSAILSDTYQLMAANANMASTAAQYTTVGLVIGKFPLFTAILGLIIMVVMYKTWQT
jgi:hypothetical protein